MLNNYTCARCKNHCSVELSNDSSTDRGFFSNCCGDDLRGADGELVSLPQLIRDICEEQRKECWIAYDNVYLDERIIIRTEIANAPLPEIEGLK